MHTACVSLRSSIRIQIFHYFALHEPPSLHRPLASPAFSLLPHPPPPLDVAHSVSTRQERRCHTYPRILLAPDLNPCPLALELHGEVELIPRFCALALSAPGTRRRRRALARCEGSDCTWPHVLTCATTSCPAHMLHTVSCCSARTDALCCFTSPPRERHMSATCCVRDAAGIHLRTEHGDTHIRRGKDRLSHTTMEGVSGARGMRLREGCGRPDLCGRGHQT